ncbi:MAG: outer membrane beta-barrel protein [Gammaproteobacteria bacterium]
MQKFARLLLILFLAFGATVTFASGTGFFLGFNVDEASIDADDVTVDGTTYSADSKETYGAGGNIGYNFSKYIGWEGGGFYFGNIDYTEGAEREQYFIYAAIKPMIQTNFGLLVFGRLGGGYYETNVTSLPTDEDVDQSTGAAIYGAGVGFNLTPQFEIDLSANRISNSDAPVAFVMLDFSFHNIPVYTKSGFLVDD